MTKPSLTDLETARADLESHISEMFRRRWELDKRIAELHPTAELPTRRRDRTETQEKVARCPRCGTRIPQEGELSPKEKGEP